MFTGSLYGLVRILVVGSLAYLLLIAILRVSGKRTLSKMNAFDFIVTVALGSILATVMLSKDVPLAEGILAFSLLAALQFAIAWSAQRAPLLETAIKSEPRILLWDGQVDEAALLDERVTRDEIKAAVRKSGAGDLVNIAAVVLETDGSFSVIARDAAGDGSALPER